MRNEQMQFRDLPFHRRPFRRVVVAMRMVSENRQNCDNRTYGCNAQASNYHGHSPFIDGCSLSGLHSQPLIYKSLPGHRSSRARRWRGWKFPFLTVSRGVVSPVANSLPLFINKLQRLLKQSRRRRTPGHGCLQDIESGVVPVDRGESAGSIGISELESMSFNLVRVIPGVVRHLDAGPLKELKRRVDDRSLHISPPAVSASVAFSPSLLALVGFRCVYFFGTGVIDHRDGVAARAARDGVDVPRQRDAIFRLVIDVLYLGITREIDMEEIRLARVIGPFLGE